MATKPVVSIAVLVICAVLIAGCPPEEYSLTVQLLGQGSVVLNPAGPSYESGTVVELTAVPVSSWRFDHWEGDLSGDANPSTATMNEDRQIQAVFLQEAGEGEGEGEQDLFVEVPDPLSGDNPVFPLGNVPAPNAGQSVADADFGLGQTRVTQTLGLRHEYSRHDPFNADHSMILLTHIPSGEWRVYRTDTIPYDGTPIVATLAIEEPRWDPIEPNILWGTTEFRIVKIDVRTPDTPILVKDFAADPVIAPVLNDQPDIYRITMKDEGEASIDKRYWAFILQGTHDDYRARYLFTWDAQTDQVPGLYTLALNNSDIDWVGMSPLGDWVLVGGMDTNQGNLAGLVMADRTFSQFHRLDFSTAHADVGLDSEGREVIVMQNVRTDYIDLIPVDLTTMPILESGGSYAGTNRVPLVRLYYSSDANGFQSGVHISCNTPGYCVVSTTTEPAIAGSNWLDRKIILVTLKRNHPRVLYLARVFGSVSSYWEETHASIARDGRNIVWTSNWSKNNGQEQVWLMRLDMPARWQQQVQK